MSINSSDLNTVVPPHDKGFVITEKTKTFFNREFHYDNRVVFKAGNKKIPEIFNVAIESQNRYKDTAEIKKKSLGDRIYELFARHPRWITLEIGKNDKGESIYVKANYNSLKKQFSNFKQNLKQDTVDFSQLKLDDLETSKLTELVDQNTERLLYTLQINYINDILKEAHSAVSFYNAGQYNNWTNESLKSKFDTFQLDKAAHQIDILLKTDSLDDSQKQTLSGLSNSIKYYISEFKKISDILEKRYELLD